MTTEGVRDAVLNLLVAREPRATIHPSGVARRVAAEANGAGEANWRGAMPIVHAAVDHLVDEGTIKLSWKGRLCAMINCLDVDGVRRADLQAAIAF